MRLVESLADLMTRFRGEDYIASLYQQMHKEKAFPGHSWRSHLDTLCQVIPNLETKTIVDFGCGPRGGLSEHFGANVIPYDPFVEQFSTPPWGKKFDVVFSSDVIEHMTLSQIDTLLTNIQQSESRFAFLNISTRKAFKRFPSGGNVHITVHSTRWWLKHLQALLGASFSPILAREDILRSEATFCFQR